MSCVQVTAYGGDLRFTLRYRPGADSSVISLGEPVVEIGVSLALCQYVFTAVFWGGAHCETWHNSSSVSVCIIFHLLGVTHHGTFLKSSSVSVLIYSLLL